MQGRAPYFSGAQLRAIKIPAITIAGAADDEFILPTHQNDLAMMVLSSAIGKSPLSQEGKALLKPSFPMGFHQGGNQRLRGCEQHGIPTAAASFRGQ